MNTNKCDWCGRSFTGDGVREHGFFDTKCYCSRKCSNEAEAANSPIGGEGKKSQMGCWTKIIIVAAVLLLLSLLF